MITHCVSALCDVGADAALTWLGGGLNLGKWALGSLNTVDIGNGIVSGTAIDSGLRTYSRLTPDPVRGIVICEVGTDPAALSPWIWLLVQPAGHLGGHAGQSVVTILAWRPGGMDDADWQMVQRQHEVEVLIIKGLLERRTG